MHISESILLTLLCVGVQANSPSSSFCSKVTSIVSKAGAQSLATAFCSSYIHIPVSTITTTIAPITTTTTTITTTVQGGDVTTTTTVQGGDSTTTSTVNSCPSPTTTVKAKAKRNSKPKPNCLSTYSPGAPLSSACSCLSIPPSTTTVTKTAAVSTSTVKTTSTVNKAGSTITSTQTNPGATSTSYVLAAPTSCTRIVEGSNEVVYDYYFSGCGVTENKNNPGDPYDFTVGPYAALDSCSAILFCADEASEAQGLDGNGDYSFDVHHLTSGDWVCVLYSNPNTNPSYFNVQDSGVLEAYGYSGTSI